MTWSDWCSYQNSIEGSAWKDNEGFVCHDALSYDIYDRNGNKVFWNAEIVAGYYNNEPFSIITFTIDGVSYTAIEGQTWGDWVEEHSDEFQVGGHPAVSNGITKKPDGMVAVCTLTGGMRSPVNTTDIIVDGYAYVFRDYSVR